MHDLSVSSASAQSCLTPLGHSTIGRRRCGGVQKPSHIFRRSSNSNTSKTIPQNNCVKYIGTTYRRWHYVPANLVRTNLCTFAGTWNHRRYERPTSNVEKNLKISTQREVDLSYMELYIRFFFAWRLLILTALSIVDTLRYIVTACSIQSLCTEVSGARHVHVDSVEPPK